MTRNWMSAPVLALCLTAACRSSTAAPVDNGGGPAVYVMTNQPRNAVVRFARNADGTLGAADSAFTGGAGTGASLESQGALVLSDDHRYLLATNAGSDEITVFRIHDAGLEVIARVPSGGTVPVSIAVHGDLAYVLNAGDPGNVFGFKLTSGIPTRIARSSRPLSGSGTQPAEVRFTPDGSELVVTEKATGFIDLYQVLSDSTTSLAAPRASAGPTPFGFAFAPGGELLVSNANAPGGNAVPDGSSLTAYTLGAGQSLNVAAGPVPTTETAACWVAATGDGRFAYTSNTGSASITGYALPGAGGLALLTPGGKTAVTGGAGAMPTDIALSSDGQFLYVLNSGAGTVAGYRVNADGSLTQVASAGGLPANSYGLAVF